MAGKHSPSRSWPRFPVGSSLRLKDRFNLPYVYCGCPLPDENISDRLARIKHKVSRAALGPTGDLVPPLRLDAILATHPSDHNAFYIGARTEDAQRRLIKRQLKASRKCQELDNTHEQAFLRPLDVYDGSEPGCIISAGSLSPYSWVTVSSIALFMVCSTTDSVV